jgi:RNA polymerase II C-terminal domain phosphatase-like 3/4
MEKEIQLRISPLIYIKKTDDPNQTLFRLGRYHMLTKLRPFVRTFLKEAKNLFEMYIYTMGEYAYAMEIAKLLDPGDVYFPSKVICQSDSTTRNQKGLDVVLGADNLVVILDDTEHVRSVNFYLD